MTLQDLSGKNIAIVGLGVNNQKMAEYFTKHKINFDVVQDWRNPEELVGKLDRYQIIFRTPGLPYLSPAIQQAQKAGAAISSQTKLFFDLCPAPIIGVTGTKGKGTTSSLIAKILQLAGKKVFLGGNFGRDPFEFLDELTANDWVILELSSFQLQDLHKSPHIAVVLNITSDHLNYHKDVAEYIDAKKRILQFQSASDFALLHPQLPVEFQKLGLGQKIIFDPQSVQNVPTKLLGRHNWENIAAAMAVARLLKIPEMAAKQAVAEFEPLPHRLKTLKTVNGTTYVDDTFSTNVDPTIAAIRAFDQPIVLITGGSDKGIDFSRLVQEILSSNKVKAVVAIGQVAGKILSGLKGYQGQVLQGAKNMQEILQQARGAASSGDVILFSPATASFGMFRNEYDRAEQFVSAVNQL